MSRWTAARMIARKDLLIEWRSKVALYQVVPFAIVVLVVFAFALDAKAVRFEETPGGATRSVGLLPLVAPGLIWLTVLFSLLLMVQRSYAIEREDGAADALRLAGIDPMAVMWGKAIALAAQVLALEVAVVALAAILYDFSIPVTGLGLLVLTMLLATAALAIVGTLYGALTNGATSGREQLLPLLAIPALAPVIIAATRSVESAFGTDAVALDEGWPWIGLLGVYTVALLVGGSLAYGPLSEDEA